MELLSDLGRHVGELRRARKMTRDQLARKAGLSPRFLADVEAGHGNIAISRLADLCAALDVSLSAFVTGIHPENNKSLALIGLRGAGKTTLGKKVAARLRWKFVELDDLVEKAAGLTLQNIFEVHGEEYYRKLEYQALQNLISKEKTVVIAVGGGVVTREETYNVLRQHCLTIWLKAKPQDHWDRVLRQDPRPMTNYPNAMAQLRALLASRESLYSRANYTVDTSALGISKSADRILACVTSGDPSTDSRN